MIIEMSNSIVGINTLAFRLFEYIITRPTKNDYQDKNYSESQLQ
jgi:hypothetical protein